jgi:hypothetical protein
MRFFFSFSPAMAKFLSGPPGGRTLPHTATRLSDLAGGVYGSGASVASTGLNAQRPPIKAGAAHAAGETWNDILEYYQVNILIRFHKSPVIVIDFDIVQCGQRRNRLCLSLREDILSGEHLRLAGWDRLWKRRRRKRFARFPTRPLLFQPHRSPSVAAGSPQPITIRLAAAKGGAAWPGGVCRRQCRLPWADVSQGRGSQGGRCHGEDVVRERGGAFRS